MHPSRTNHAPTLRTSLLAVILCGLGLTACGGASSDKSTAADTGPAASASAIANQAPTISGTPVTTVSAGGSYSFVPQAVDADGDSLGFSIENKPAWAAFNTSTGTLSGAPTAAQAGAYQNIVITVSDGKVSTAMASFNITVAAAVASNSVAATPTIAGTPASTINVGHTYTFRPTAADANGDALTFSVQNKPTWASFDAGTGSISGTPTAGDVNTYANVVISVTDGAATASLPAFSIVVTPIAMGAVSLSWQPPTENTDGSAVSSLAGYRIHYGTSVDSLDQVVTVEKGSTGHLVENLAPSTWHFAVTAYTSDGAESDYSNIISRTVM